MTFIQSNKLRFDADYPRYFDRYDVTVSCTFMSIAQMHSGVCPFRNVYCAFMWAINA